MKIAVLMSTYNGEAFLNLQMQSLSEQTVVDSITVYIRDDRSTDNTINIIQKWEKKIKIILIQGINKGPAMSFWDLLKYVPGEFDYYAFCDQDDIWDKDKLEIATGYLNDDVHLYTCNCRSIDANNNIFEKKRRKEYPVISIETLFVSGVTQGCAMVFSKKLKEYICNLHITTIPMHDLIVMLYALQMGRVYWDIEPHFSYRFHSNNVIAKEKKKVFSKLLTTVRRWDKNKNVSMSNVATELLAQVTINNVETEKFLRQISNYKKSIKSKYLLLNNKKIRSCNQRALRSFYIRIILNYL
ncbi:glycosyltransferase [Anaerocolumna chitinilytica]|uniref:Glycosyltransferase 2-like domain-containing protein n=1 Tax=Anaerocolumna chitinilytica TaxID=1727145 RepID=A0A7I8DG47_9FIRM|nr:glycosyltransferase [Anaerocolumna chitinilytica]BCJ97360.1 hypothetical protein bsdcttw_04010 [Anaerocolumna chitinilytica]